MNLPTDPNIDALLGIFQSTVTKVTRPGTHKSQVPGYQSKEILYDWTSYLWVLSMELAPNHPSGVRVLRWFLDYYKICGPLD